MSGGALGRWLLAGSLLAASASFGCGHTHAVDDAQPAASSSGSVDNAQPHHAAAKPAVKETSNSADVPVATSADALLAPGAAAQIRDKLRAQGFLGDDDTHMNAGLRKFQAQHDLPETGVPDHQTVAKLGLDPGKIFRRTEVK